MEPVDRPLQDEVHGARGTLRTVALGAWAVGALSNEAFTAAGMVLLVAWGAWAWAASELTPRDAARRWWPLWAFVGWALIVPLLAGRVPTGAGVARVLDWAALPLAAAAWMG